MDEEDEGPTSVTLPSPSVQGPDSNGVKTYIDYKWASCCLPLQ